MVLLVTAGLLWRSLRQLQGVDPGFRTEGLLAVDVQLPGVRSPPEQTDGYREALEGLRRIPGVRAAAGTDMHFFDLSPRYFTEVGRLDADLDDFVTTDWRVVTEDYFQTVGMQLLAGRFLDKAQGGSGIAEVMVSAALAEQLWAGEDAVDQLLRWDGPSGAITRVVGIVGDVSDVHPALPQVASAYRSYHEVPRRAMTLLLRSELPPPDLAALVRTQIKAVDAGATLSEIRAVEERYADVVALDRFLPSFFALVAAVAVSLAGLGVYGLVSFTVVRRAHEIGIRMALGGHVDSIVRMLFGHGARLVATGILLGAGAALSLTRLLRAVLFETEPTDPLTYVAVGVFLTVVGLIATYVPARRAITVDPVDVLPV